MSTTAIRFIERARAEWDAGRRREAIPLIRRAIGAAGERRRDLEYWLLDALFSSGREHDLEEGIRRSLELADEQGGPLTPEQRAHLLSRRSWAMVVPAIGDAPTLAEAESSMTRSAQLHPTGRPDASTLALISIRRGRASDALALCDQVAEISEGARWTGTNRAAALALQALALAYTGNVAEAREAARKAEESDPEAPLLAEVQRYLGGPQFTPAVG